MHQITNNRMTFCVSRDTFYGRGLEIICSGMNQEGRNHKDTIKATGELWKAVFRPEPGDRDKSFGVISGSYRHFCIRSTPPQGGRGRRGGERGAGGGIRGGG